MFDIETIRRRGGKGSETRITVRITVRIKRITVTRGRAFHPLERGAEDTGERLHSSESRGGEEEEEEEEGEEAGDVAAGGA